MFELDHLDLPATTRKSVAQPTALATALAAALDLVNEGVLLLAPDLTVLASNTAAKKLLGQTTLSGTCLAEVLTQSTATQLRAAARLLSAGQGPRATLIVAPSLQPTQGLEVAIHATLALEGNALAAVIRPASSETETAKTSGQFRDYLTGLPTRAALATRLEQLEQRARRHGGQYAILFIDLDHFKQLNDEHGHAAGDCVLQLTAERLQTAVRPADLVARFGGDEFVVVVEDVAPAQAARLAKRIRTMFSAPFPWNGDWLVASASIGRAHSDSACSAEEVVARADRAMYRDKNSRRNRHPR